MKITDPTILQYQEKMTKAEEALQRELGTIRAGVANASLLNRVNVEYYGVPTPLNQMAQISVPEARVLLITPYDKSSLKDIEHALLASDLGIAPMNDGSAIRLVIPQLTEERRKLYFADNNGARARRNRRLLDRRICPVILLTEVKICFLTYLKISRQHKTS